VASVILGRTACPECGFTSAHVKQSEKCLYRHCPECGSTYHTKGDKQRADLMAKTRAEGDAPATSSTPKPAPASAAPAAPPPAKAKPAGLFNFGG
jgi:ssDNA-binding Zn-finger/Zn-ribbon topoisomerase 1